MSDTGEETFAELVSRAVDDAKTVGRAELAVLRAQARLRLEAYRNGAILLGAAATLGSAAVVAAAVGAILALAPHVGPALATLIVFAVILALCGLLAKLGIDQVRATRKKHRGE